MRASSRARLVCYASAAIVLLMGGCAQFQRASRTEIDALLPAGEQDWNRPLRLTRGPGAEYDGGYDPRHGALVYVADLHGSADVYRKSDVLTGLEPAVRRAAHPAPDRWARAAAPRRRPWVV